jgi:hypothetical protein
MAGPVTRIRAELKSFHIFKIAKKKETLHRKFRSISWVCEFNAASNGKFNPKRLNNDIA